MDSLTGESELLERFWERSLWVRRVVGINRYSFELAWAESAIHRGDLRGLQMAIKSAMRSPRICERWENLLDDWWWEIEEVTR